MKPRLSKFVSMRFLTVVIIAIFAVNFFIIGSFENEIRRNSLSEAGQAMLISSNRVASILESESDSLKNNLDVISRFRDVKSGDAATCTAKLQEISPIYKPKISSLVRLDAEGIVYCASDSQFLGLDRSGTSHIKKILNDEKHEAVVSDFKKSIDADEWSITIHVPVFDDNGKFSGTVGGVLVFDQMSSQYLKNITSITGSRALILDSDGGIIFFRNYPELAGKNWLIDEVKISSGSDVSMDWIVKDSLAGKSGTGFAVLENSDAVVSYSSASLPGNKKWGIVISAPEKNVVRESSAGSGAFLLLYAGPAITIIAFIAIALTALSGFAKYTIESLAEEIVADKRKKGRRR